MRGVRWALGILPPFLAGAAAAAVAELSAILLLYSEEGFLVALTLILTVDAAALGLGVGTAPLHLGGGVVEQVRRRWLLVMVAMVLASVLAAGLLGLEDLSGSHLGQGLGLAFLASLPLFALGSLLGAMARAEAPGQGPVARVGVPSLLGGAAGFFGMGTVLLPNMAPHTIYLTLLAVLSAAALLQGWVLDTRPVWRVRESLASPRGEVRVEDRVVGSPRREVTVLVEGGRLRGAETSEGAPGRAWEAAVLTALLDQEEPPGSVLYLGGGSGTLARHLWQANPGIRLHLVEEGPQVQELARRHFLPWEGWTQIYLQCGDPVELLAHAPGPYATVVVDGEVLPLREGVPFLREGDWAALAGAVDPAGAAVVGGFYLMPELEREVLEELLAAGARHFARVALYERGADGTVPGLLPGEGVGTEAFLLLTGPRGSLWSPELPGFSLRQAEEA